MFGAVSDAEWFDSENVEAQRIRDACNLKILEDMILFLQEHPNGVCILDSTNPTHERRQRLVDRVRFADLFIQTIFVRITLVVASGRSENYFY